MKGFSRKSTAFVFLLFAVTVASSAAFAQAARGNVTTTNAGSSNDSSGMTEGTTTSSSARGNTTSTQTTTASSGTTTTGTGSFTGYGQGTGGRDMNRSARSAQGIQMVGTAVNGATAVFMATRCGKQCWPCCAMAAMAAAQAAQMAAAAGGSGRSAAASNYQPPTGSYNGGTGDSNGNSGSANGDGTNGGLQPTDPNARQMREQLRQVGQVTQQMRDQGYMVSPDGSKVKLPDGRTVPTSSFGSASGLSQIGASQDAINAAMAAHSEASKYAKLKIKGMGLDMGDGGGGGGSSGAGSRSASRGGGGGGFNFNMFDEKKKKPASLNGLSKTYGDSRIGVAQDNIFEMISKQYINQSRSQAFIEAPDSVPSAVPARGAASVPVGGR